MRQCGQMPEYKVAKFCPKITQKWPKSVYLRIFKQPKKLPNILARFYYKKCLLDVTKSAQSGHTDPHDTHTHAFNNK